MKNLTLILIAAFGLNSCVKKEEEVVVPYTCQDCVEIYKTETTSYWGDTIYSSKIDTIKFTYCETYGYQQNNNGTFITPINQFDSLGNTYVRGWKNRLLFYWTCKYK